MIYCSIDVMDGKAVQLVQGRPENKKIEEADIMALALKFSVLGPMNVIDLDAAMDRGSNSEILVSLAERFPIRVGGGIRSVEQAEAYVTAGAQKIIIGSKALDEKFLRRLVDVVQKDRIVIALDSFKDEVVIRGWSEKTSLKPEQMVQVLEPYCSEFLCTQVEREGLMNGFDLDRCKKLRRLTELPIAAAGGISSLDEIERLEEAGIGSVLGMALYSGKIDYDALLKFVDLQRGGCSGYD